MIAIFSLFILLHLARVEKSASRTLGAGKQKRHGKDKKRHAGRMLVLVVVLFALLWLPVHIHLLDYYFDELPSGRAYMAATVLFSCLAYFNSCVNPIIYNRTSKEFRDAFMEVCGCRRRERSNSADVADGRRVTLVTHLTPDKRRHLSCTATYFPTPSEAVSPSAMQKSATASDHLSATSPNCATTLQLSETHKANLLVVPTTSQHNQNVAQ